MRTRTRGHGHTENTHAGEVVLAKLPPETLVEATDTVVGVGSTLAVGYPVEEVAIVCALLPHPLHLSGTWLEVSKILLAKPRLLVDLDVVPLEGRGLGLVRSQCGQDPLGGLPCAAVGRGEEVQRVVGAEHLAQAPARIVGLLPAILSQLDAVVRNRLVDLAVLCRGRKATSAIRSCGPG